MLRILYFKVLQVRFAFKFNVHGITMLVNVVVCVQDIGSFADSQQQNLKECQGFSCFEQLQPTKSGKQTLEFKTRA